MKLSLRGYLRFLRRQHVNIQHAHAFFFAFVITMFIAVTVLYFEYGFFRTKYDKEQIVLEEEIKNQKMESPTEMLTSFFRDGQEKFSNIKESGTDFLKGKETFTR